MNSERLFLLLAVFFLSCCGVASLRSLKADPSSPYVAAVAPSDEAVNETVDRIVLTFSEPVLAETVTDGSVVLVPREAAEAFSDEPWDDFADAIEDGDVVPVAVRLALSSDGLALTLEPETPPVSPGDYAVVALPRLLSLNRYPLDQRAAGAAEAVFRSFFAVREFLESGSESESGIGADAGISGSAGGEGDATAAATGTTADPETAAESGVNDDNEEISVEEAGDEAFADTDEPPSPPPSEWGRVFISEIVTDPQSDHGDSSGGDGVPFNAFPGAGTVGSTDEFIEIYNGTGESVDLTGWNVVMTDGSDVAQPVDETGWSLHFGSAGEVKNFLAGEALVLGNPQGDMKNSVTVDLYDGAGSLRDSVFVEDGNADSPEDESYRLDEAGNWGFGPADPGEFL